MADAGHRRGARRRCGKWEEYHTHHPVGFDRVKRENSKAMWMLGFYVVSFFGIFCGRIEGDHVSGRVFLDLA